MSSFVHSPRERGEMGHGEEEGVVSENHDAAGEPAGVDQRRENTNEEKAPPRQ